MLRSHTCGELTANNIGDEIVLCGWIQRSRDLGGMTFIDLRDRYGITQLVFNMDTDKELCERARKMGREFVIKVQGLVSERSNKNRKMATGEIEIVVSQLEILNNSETPPFTIEENTDGGEDLRMKYRYLDLRRTSVRQNMELRHRVCQTVRNYLDGESFIEVETPVLIKSTPEGARDFVVPARQNPGHFYALPQSPQLFKQLLMVSGFDRYFQIVKCFRDEDLRADRQPEFTQIDCEMSFVTQEDIIQTFEGLIRNVFQNCIGVDLGIVERMTYQQAMNEYGSDKPDTRFEMKFVHLNHHLKESGFAVFDQAEAVVGIVAKGQSEITRKQIDQLTDFVKRPQVGATGLIYIKYNADGTIKSSVDKHFDFDKLSNILQESNASTGDCMFILAGGYEKTLKAMNELRLHLGEQLGLRNKTVYKALWVTDFPLLEYDQESGKWFAKHHPFTSPKSEDVDNLEKDPGNVRANAYDLVVNGVELGGGSVRIHNKELQQKIFNILGFSAEEAQMQFGFLMNAFKFGAPPHAGIAFGLDRLCAVLHGSDSIRDFIAFPKNNAGKDVMIDAPSSISQDQLKDLGLAIPKD